MPTRATRNKRASFLEAIRRGCTVAAATEHARVDRTLPYVWEKEDPQFARHWQEARDSRLTQLKDTAFDLALAGSEGMIRYLLNRYEHIDEKETTLKQIEIIMPGGTPNDGQDFITLN
jgi:transposase